MRRLRWMGLRFALAAVLVADGVAARGLSAPRSSFDPEGSGADPFAFVLPSSLGTAERAKLDAGDTIIKVLPASDPELNVFGATRINVGADRLVAWAREVHQLYKGPYMQNVRRFSTPPVIDDLAALTLNDKDLEDARRCRPGDCGLKLNAREIDALRQAIAAAGANWKAAAQHAFREVVLARARQDLANGSRGGLSYDDRDPPVFPHAELEALMKSAGPLLVRLPQVAQGLTQVPRLDTPGVESFLYWSKDTLGRRPTVNLMHLSIIRSTDPNLPEALVISRQVFASHYVTGSLGLSAITRGGGGSPRYLLYLSRSRIDVLDGRFAGLVRRIIERRVRSEAPRVLEEMRRRLESGDPTTM